MNLHSIRFEAHLRVGRVFAGIGSAILLIALSGCLGLPAPSSSPVWRHSEAIEKSPLDRKTYRALELGNGLKVLLVSDPATEKAAAALDVNVGSQSDPADREGLAHYMEHMLFLGTEKYPEAGDYKKFIDDRGGQNNAYTSGEHTNYHFSVNAADLAPALDRFAQFFIAPLFTPKYVQRERAIVHSEFMARRTDERRRLWAAQREVYHPGHPARQFSVGNLQTLADRQTDGPQPDWVRDDLLAFYERHYHAGNMALVVLGKSTLDTLEDLVRDTFSAIRADASIPDAVPTRPPLLAADSLPVQLTLKPLTETYRVTFGFPIPSTEPYRAIKPLSLVASILGHEGPGSVLASLKADGWAEGLSAGVSYMDDQDGVLDVSVQLTAEGLSHLDEIGDRLFAMISMTETSGVEAWRYREDEQLSDIAFRFQEDWAPYQLVRSLASRVHDWPPEQVLAGPYRYQRWAPELVKRYLARLTPDNLILTVVDPAFDASSDTSPWYEVAYQRTRVADARLKRWQVARSGARDVAGLALPEPNPFVPQDLALVDRSGMTLENQAIDGARAAGHAVTPTVIHDSALIRAWHQTDNQFNLPKSHFYFSLRSPVAADSPRHAVLTELWVKAINEQLNAFSYPAYEAGLHYQLYRHTRGVSVRLTGYRDKQQALLERLLGAISKGVLDGEKFEQYRLELGRDLTNQLRERPLDSVMGSLYDALMENSWSVRERMDALERVDVDMLRAHRQQFLSSLQIVALSWGSVSERDSIARVNALEQAFTASTPVAVARPRLNTIGAGQSLAYAMTLSQPDSAYVMYVQGDTTTPEEIARVMLMSKLVEPRFYKELRTEQKVGYLVHSHAFNLLDKPALLWSIQSNSHSVAEIDALVQTFSDSFLAALETLEPAEYETVKTSLLLEFSKPDRTLDDVVGRAWREIDREALAFDTRAKLIEAVKATSLAAVRQQARTMLDRPSARRLLAVSEGKLGRAEALTGWQWQESPEAVRSALSGVTASALAAQ